MHVSVSLGEPKDIGGFGLAVDIKAEGVDEEVLQAAHKVSGAYAIGEYAQVGASTDVPLQPCFKPWCQRQCLEGLSFSNLIVKTTAGDMTATSCEG